MKSRSNIVVIIAGLVAVAAIVGVGILPSYKRSLELDKEIARAELMEKLGPYSRAISLSLARMDKDLSDFIRNEPIPSDKVEAVTETFRRLALKNRVDPEEINPDIGVLDFSQPEKAELDLTVNLVVEGELANMQSFLRDCTRLHFFKSIDKMGVARWEGSLRLSVTMKLAVSRKKGRA
jgi:hypothetical protein